MGQNVHEMVIYNTWESVAEQYDNVFDEAIREHTHMVCRGVNE
jgi:hypothetical protein